MVLDLVTRGIFLTWRYLHFLTRYVIVKSSYPKKANSRLLKSRLQVDFYTILFSQSCISLNYRQLFRFLTSIQLYSSLYLYEYVALRNLRALVDSKQCEKFKILGVIPSSPLSHFYLSLASNAEEV